MQIPSTHPERACAPLRPAHLSKPLHLPRRSQCHSAEIWANYARPIPLKWSRLADEKGFHIHSRIRDRGHVVLECQRCGALTAQKVYTLRTALPACGGCQFDAQQQAAAKAGLQLLARDTSHRHYRFYRAECGHVLRRSDEFVARLGAGQTGLRCEICLSARYTKAALRHGWTLIGADSEKEPSYRLYRHSCGHEKRVALVNMRWGQVACDGCGTSWPARESYIYLISITFECGLELLKLGYSAHPRKRYRHQFKLPKSAHVSALRIIRFPSGSAALRIETALHRYLRKRLPATVMARDLYRDKINVTREIYTLTALPEILRRLDQIEAALQPDQAR